jgi:hypothetical protein
LPEKEHLQPLEVFRATVKDEFVPQCLDYPIKHSKGPAPFEDSLRRLIVRRLTLVPLFAGREFKRQKHPATAFLRAITVPFVGHKEF